MPELDLLQVLSKNSLGLQELQTFHKTLSNISWQEMNGMRNRLVHEYDDINLNIVWDVVQKEIPILIQQLKSIVPPEK